MLLAVFAALAGLAVVVWALYTEQPVTTPLPRAPAWEELPTPADVVRVDFPLTFPGYDPASVEAHLDAVARAYGNLLAVVPAEILERARQRAAVLEEEAAVEETHVVDAAMPGSALTDVPVEEPLDEGVGREHADALRTEAALARLDTTDQDEVTPR